MSGNYLNFITMRYLPLFLLILLAACRSTKTIERVRTVTDSTATEQVKVMEFKMDSVVKHYEKKLSEISETGVVFETEPCPCDTLVERGVSLKDLGELIPNKKIIGGTAYMDSLGNIYTANTPYPKNAVTFNPNGTLKSASGNIKSVNIKTEKIQQENADLKRVVSELRDSLGNKKVELVKDEKKVDKDIERGGFPWFWVIVTAVVTLLVRWKLWPYIVKLYKHLRS